MEEKKNIITVDGIEVELNGEQNLLEVIRKAGIDLPYDQNFLAALSVPRHLIIGSAETDEWSDPESEFLCCASTTPAYNVYGMKGLVYGDEIPKAKTVLGEGEALYQIRKGNHYFSREDWLVYMEYIDKQLGR